ncbi:MAG: Disaggregatase related repeat-containing protein [Candidatus Methanomarinus sp.]|nr:MAG: Disaggregatase related repeat-containing protein [ANME-2 cluster archaeon]
MDVGKIKNEKYSGVIWFDLSQYNSTDKIETATLSLLWYYDNREQSTQVSIYRPAEWDPQYVTWNSCADGAQWNNPDGDWYDKNNVAQGAEAYETVVFSQDTAPDGQYHNFDITQLVQSYVDGTYENTGLLIKADNENDGYIAFYSTDHPNVNQQPKLTIVHSSQEKSKNRAPVLSVIGDKSVNTLSLLEFTYPPLRDQ